MDNVLTVRRQWDKLGDLAMSRISSAEEPLPLVTS
jgi:hypothetical protein